MVINSINTSYIPQESSIQRQKEDAAEINELVRNTAPVESQTENNNELPRTQTVNETNNIQETQKFEQNQEISNKVTEERNNIQRGRQSVESSLGQNIDITV